LLSDKDEEHGSLAAPRMVEDAGEYGDAQPDHRAPIITLFARR
jgi:hypothetical protein